MAATNERSDLDRPATKRLVEWIEDGSLVAMALGLAGWGAIGPKGLYLFGVGLAVYVLVCRYDLTNRGRTFL